MWCNAMLCSMTMTMTVDVPGFGKFTVPTEQSIKALHVWQCRTGF